MAFIYEQNGETFANSTIPNSTQVVIPPGYQISFVAMIHQNSWICVLKSIEEDQLFLNGIMIFTLQNDHFVPGLILSNLLYTEKGFVFDINSKNLSDPFPHLIQPDYIFLEKDHFLFVRKLPCTLR